MVLKNKISFIFLFISFASIAKITLVLFKNNNKNNDTVATLQTPTAPLVQDHQTMPNNHKPKSNFSGDKKTGFESITHETPLQKIPYQGTMPTWLKGALIGTGPAQFEMGPTIAAYWFNGLAMLQAFYFDGVDVSYQSAFLKSTYYNRCIRQGKFDSSMSNEKPKGFFSRLASAAFTTPEPYDNGTIGINIINDSYIAMTETTLGVEFDPATLKTKQPFNLNKNLEGHLTTAQFKYDSDEKTWYNYMINFGTTSAYQIYKITPDNKHTLITSLPTKTPSYMRSFAMTKNYIILIEIPFTINPFDLLLGAGAFIEKIQWKPELGTNFIVINKHTGQRIGDFKTETPFFIFNTINAYEENNSIVIDAITYANNKIIACTTLKTLRSDNEHEYEPSFVTRFTVNVPKKTVFHKQISLKTVDFPTINETKFMNPYTFIYGIGANLPHKFPHQLLKINIKKGMTSYWQEDHCFAGKPVFIAKPHANDEDEGVILSIVFNSATKQSFLLILDAKTFNELGRAFVPNPIPLGVMASFNPAFSLH